MCPGVKSHAVTKPYRKHGEREQGDPGRGGGTDTPGVLRGKQGSALRTLSYTGSARVLSTG